MKASKYSDGNDTMHIEFNALIQNDTWDLIPPQQDHKLVGNIWVYRVKKA